MTSRAGYADLARSGFGDYTIHLIAVDPYPVRHTADRSGGLRDHSGRDREGGVIDRQLPCEKDSYLNSMATTLRAPVSGSLS